jgi:hypothetical protein
MVSNKFYVVRCLVNKRLFWYFRQLVQRTKSCPVVQWGTRISVFVLSLGPICLVPETDLKSNTVQLKLLCPVPYFLANQTHPINKCKEFNLCVDMTRDYTCDYFAFTVNILVTVHI